MFCLKSNIFHIRTEKFNNKMRNSIQKVTFCVQLVFYIYFIQEKRENKGINIKMEFRNQFDWFFIKKGSDNKHNKNFIKGFC